MNEATQFEIIEKTKRYMVNPLVKTFLNNITKDCPKCGNRLRLILKNHVEDVELCLSCRVLSSILKIFLNNAGRLFGVKKSDIEEVFQHPYMRRAFENVLRGIQIYGVQEPFISYAPFLIVWDFTNKCNLSCKHCYQKAGELSKELTTEQAKKLIDELADFGVSVIAFSGGEPLIREDFFEVAKYAKSKDFFISIASNGTLITEDMAKKLKDSGVEYVEISLDGLEKTHDSFRGIKGAFQRTVKGIKNCVNVGLDTCIAMTITKHNFNEVEDVLKFAKEIGVKRFIMFNFVPVGRGKDIIKLDLSPEEREKILKFLYDRLQADKSLLTLSTAPQYCRIAMEYIKKYEDGVVLPSHFTNETAIKYLRGKTATLANFIGGCGAGRVYGAVEPNGDITPCVFMKIKLGNVLKDSFKAIWLNHLVLKELRDRTKFKGYCGVCEYRSVCGGCRARAYGYFKDLRAPDPGCINNLEYWNEIAK